MGSAQEQMEAVLNGTASYHDAPDYIKSAIRIHIYFKASAILDLPRDKMKQAGEQLPPEIRDLVREECKRLLEYRLLEKNIISPRNR